MIVSIARELGAGGLTVGGAVASAVGATLLDERSIIEELARRQGVSHAFLAERLERPPSAGARFVADLAAATAMFAMPATWYQADDAAIVEGVRDLIVESAQRGNVVVIGHGGVSLLGWRPGGIPVLAMLLRAGRAWRVEQLARRFAIDPSEAQRRMQRIDEARERYQRHYFNVDLYDSRQYDLVLNSETLGLDRAVEIATEVARAFADANAALA